MSLSSVLVNQPREEYNHPAGEQHGREECCDSGCIERWQGEV